MSSRAAWLLALTLMTGLALLHGTRSLTRVRRLSPDSMNYINVAENLLAGRGLAQDTLGYGEGRFPARIEFPQPFAVQAPLYPILVAAVAAVGVEVTDAALLVPALAYAGILLAAVLLVARLYDRKTAVWALLLLVLSYPLRHTTGAAWSDGPGMFFLLAGFLVVLGPSGGRLGTGMALGSGILLGLAFATRYPLVVAGPVGAALLWTRERPGAPRRVALFALGFTLIAAPIVIRNLALTGMLTGASRNPSPETVASNLARAGNVILGEYFASPTSKRDPWAATRYKEWLQVALFVAGAAVLVARLPRPRLQAFRERLLSQGRWLFVAWPLAYVGFMVLVRSIVYIDMDTRLLSPAHLFVLCAWAGLLGAVVRVPTPWLAAGVVAAGLAQGAQDWKDLSGPRPPSSRRIVRESPLLSWIRDETGSEDLIVGEDSIYVTFYLQRPTLYFTRFPWMKQLTWADLENVRKQSCPRYRNLYLMLGSHAWTEEDWQELYGPVISDLAMGRHAAYPGLEPVTAVSDGTVFRLTCTASQRVRLAVVGDDDGFVLLPGPRQVFGQPVPEFGHACEAHDQPPFSGQKHSQSTA